MKTEKALQIITRQCSRKEFCSNDVLKKLQDWDLPEKETNDIMNFLFQHKFVDDVRFAQNYAEDKFRFNHWGKQKIMLMLQRKKIPSEIITEAIQHIDQQNYQQGCKMLLKQKMNRIQEKDPYKLKAKLLRFGIGRGFDLNTLHACLSELFLDME